MPGSVRAAYSEVEDFDAALRSEGCLSLLITAPGQFRAQLTQISLIDLRLSGAEENLPRIAFVEVPTDSVVISFPIGSAPAPVWSGIGVQKDDFMILCAGDKIYARTDGSSRWGAIRVPVKTLVEYGVALAGTPFDIPTIARRWRPPRSAGRQLRGLHTAATRMAISRPQLLVDATAAHGLEQQLLHAVLECLAETKTGDEVRAERGDQEIMAGFQQVLQSKPDDRLSMAEICTTLRVSSTQLRRLCSEHLGMNPIAYDRLRRMSLVRRALGRGGSATESITAAAHQNGFRDLRRFATSYRAAFGKSPDATLLRARHASRKRADSPSTSP